MSVLASAAGLAASSGLVAAWVITALVLVLLAAVFWAFLRRSGAPPTLEVDRLDQSSPQERAADVPAVDDVSAVDDAHPDEDATGRADVEQRPDAPQG